MQKDTPRSLNPLSETEQFQLNRLLARTGESLSGATQRREKELALERKLQEKADRIAAEEARLSKRLASLHVDLDVISAKLYQLAPSGIAFRTVNEQLQKLAELVPQQSFFNSRFDSLDQSQIMLLAEIGLSLFEATTRPKGKTLREKMANIDVTVGPDGPGAGAPPGDRSALAAGIVRAGRRRRGEEE